MTRHNQTQHTEVSTTEVAPTPKKRANKSLEVALAKAQEKVTGKADIPHDPTRVDWRGVNLSGKDLTSEDQYKFKRALMHESNLSGANLSEKNLQGSKWSGADVRGANFSNSDFRWADLSGMIADEDTNFDGCNMWETEGVGSIIWR